MAVDTCESDAPGWYGKLSALGDFAERRLPPEVVQLVDAWLSRSIDASRQRLGDTWLELYLTAPLFRFAWAPGIVDTAWWFGVLMPSCDNVGRYFPLLIASRRPKPPRDRLALDHLEAWFDHLAQAAAETLDPGASIEAFEAALGETPSWPAPGGPPVWPRPTGEAGEFTPFDPRTDLPLWLQGLASESLQTCFQGCSIWWQPGDHGLTATLEIVNGLPSPEAYAGMLEAG